MDNGVAPHESAQSLLKTNKNKFVNMMGAEQSVDALKIDAIEVLNFCCNQIIRDPAKFHEVMELTGEEFIAFLPHEAVIEVIVQRLYNKTVTHSGFAYHAMRILVGLVQLEGAIFETSKIRDLMLNFVRDKLKTIMETLKTSAASTLKFLAPCLFTAELYIQLNIGSDRMPLIGLAILELLETYFSAENIPLSERARASMKVLKLVGSFLDKDAPEKLSMFIELMKTKMNEDNEVDQSILTMLQNLIDLRLSNWGSNPEDPELTTTSSEDNNQQQVFAGPSYLQPQEQLYHANGLQCLPAPAPVQEHYPQIGQQPFEPVGDTQPFLPMGGEQIFQGEGQQIIPLMNNLNLMPGLPLPTNLYYPGHCDVSYQFSQPVLDGSFVHVNQAPQFLPYPNYVPTMIESAAVLYAPDGTVMAPDEEQFLRNNINNEFPSPRSSPSMSPGVDEAYSEFLRNLPSVSNHYK
ncbi:Polyadenylate-binding protein-interacting protein 1 [Homalodisca vitripennis]|nr:Polyadenylate-binding protein-interacting protein 1 [Homalodisca vitripennis]